MKEFLKRPSTLAFLGFAALYTLAIGFILWGTWSLDRAPIGPDAAVVYPVDDVARWLAAVAAGGSFIPSDLMHVAGGMYFWQELKLALAAALAALAVVYYLRGRGVPLLPRYGAGSAYGLMGYTFTLFSAGHLGWFEWLMYGPFVFGLIDRALRRGKWRHWALLGGVFAWAAARQPDIWMLFAVPTVVYALYHLVADGAARRGRTWAGVALAAACFFAVGLPQFMDALGNARTGREKQIAETTGATAELAEKDPAAARAKRWDFCTSWSLPPEDTLEFFFAGIHGDSNDPRVSPTRPYKGRLGQKVTIPAGQRAKDPTTGRIVSGGESVYMPYRQHALYFGLLALLFAGYGAAGAFRKGASNRGEVVFWLATGTVAYLCALGGFTPFYNLVFALPFGNQVRCPVKFVHVVELCTAVLAGYGAARVLAWRKGVLKWLVVALFALNVLDLARVDRAYCAVENLTFRKAPNAAAEDAAKCGEGKVVVAFDPREGQGEISENFRIHGVEAVSSPTEPGARFLFISGRTYAADKSYTAQVQAGKMKMLGVYGISLAKGVFRAQQGAAAVLMELTTPVPLPPKPAVDPVKRVLTGLSVLTTLGLALWALAAVFVRRRPRA